MLNTRYYYVIVTILRTFVQFSNSQSGENDSFDELPDLFYYYDNLSDYYNNLSDYRDNSSDFYDLSFYSDAVQFDGKYRLQATNYSETSK